MVGGVGGVPSGLELGRNLEGGAPEFVIPAPKEDLALAGAIKSGLDSGPLWGDRSKGPQSGHEVVKAFDSGKAQPSLPRRSQPGPDPEPQVSSES